MEKSWRIKQPNLALQREISQALGISEVCAQVLINRGVASVEEVTDFLSCDLANLHSPFLLKGINHAVQRIKAAVSAGQRLMVWGDYDIDGITSVALLISVLREMGAWVWHYLPNRLEEGYGLSEKGARVAKKNGVNLLITVDCGISAHRQITYFKSIGIDTIVTDHHQPPDGHLPEAVAIINPLQKGCAYPYKYLAGVGLAAKLACALLGKQKETLDKHLDLVTLGTVGDVAPLTGENRILVKHGLVSLRQTKKLGLRTLIESAGLADRELNARHIGYILGPRINASGRLGSPEDSLRLLLTEDADEAKALAEKLSQGNRTRQRLESQTLQEAIAQVESRINFKEHNIIVLGAAHWHQGVIGIVASRLVERYFRPAIMLNFEEEFGRGSGRSIGNFHLLEALNRCKDLLEEYGGHRRACGIKLRRDKFNVFFQTINNVAKEMLLPEDIIPVLEIDVAIPLSKLEEKVIAELDVLSPFGTDNPQPLICSTGLEVKSRSCVVAGNHIKFWVSDGGLTCEVIGYNKAETFPVLQAGQRIDLAYVPSINNWQGNFSIQLKIEDIKILQK